MLNNASIAGRSNRVRQNIALSGSSLIDFEIPAGKYILINKVIFDAYDTGVDSVDVNINFRVGHTATDLVAVTANSNYNDVVAQDNTVIPQYTNTLATGGTTLELLKYQLNSTNQTSGSLSKILERPVIFGDDNAIKNVGLEVLLGGNITFGDVIIEYTTLTDAEVNILKEI